LAQVHTFRKNRDAALILEDGTLFLGHGFGAPRKTTGEVVFSTSMVGYPEALTDPSYKGQILTLTYPLIGNYGVPSYDLNYGLPIYFESERIQTSGLIIHELCENPHHWASTRTLDKWLKDENIPGICGIDTRALTKKLRINGVMLGILASCQEGQKLDFDTLRTDAKSIPDPNATDLVREVSVKEPVKYEANGKYTIALIDCGVKYSIIRNLLKRGINVIRMPYDATTEEILKHNPAGVVLSNGPGDPKKCVKTIETVRELSGKLPFMGICLGAQLLTLSWGGDTYKLKFGHRAQNQPALDLKTNRCYITTQNHGYAINKESLKETPLESWFINPNDKTIEGVQHKNKPVFAVQWHPEASPGPYDTEFLFEKFIASVEANQHA
jgi:carbamoyl-phosphate synthase small subunit